MTADPPPPPRRRKDVRPAEIIAAGLAEFAEHGFEAARLDRVARRAGVAKGTLYLYFDGKEALFEAALTSRVTPVVGEVEALIDAWPGPTEALLRLAVETLYARMFEPDVQALMRIVIAEGGRFPRVAAHYHRETVSRGRAALARIVGRGVARGEFRPGPAADLPMVVMAPAVMAAVWRMTFDAVDPVPTEAFLAAHLDLVLAGLRAAPRGGARD